MGNGSSPSVVSTTKDAPSGRIRAVTQHGRAGPVDPTERRTSMKRLSLALIVVAASAIASLAQTGTTVFEGARVIVGDGRVIDNATIVVNAGKIAQVGRAADVK